MTYVQGIMNSIPIEHSWEASFQHLHHKIRKNQSQVMSLLIRKNKSDLQEFVSQITFQLLDRFPLHYKLLQA